jgi:two-component system response regulator CpxR
MDDGQRISQVLMVDDDTKLCRLVREYLAPFGFDVHPVHTGPEGAEAVLDREYDAVILDVMLPGTDGFEVLRQIRASSDVPVVMLTALGDEADRIVGLETGADDYLPKTFSTRELLARLRAVTRRSRTSVRDMVEGDTIEAGDVSINSARRLAIVSGRALDLTALEFDLLAYLVRSAGRVLNRDQILDAIAGREYDAFDRSIDVHISSLRRKLGDDFKNPRYIRTLRSIGYMFVAQPPEK